jgi:hypothetical protein
MIEAAEEPQIFASGKPSVKAEVAAGVVTKLAAHGAWVEDGIVPCDLRAAFAGEEKRGKNAEQGGFTGAVCSEQRQSFARMHFEGNPGEGYDRWFFEWLQKRPPAAARGRERLLEILNVDRDFRHDETYSVSVG